MTFPTTHQVWDLDSLIHRDRLPHTLIQWMAGTAQRAASHCCLIPHHLEYVLKDTYWRTMNTRNPIHDVVHETVLRRPLTEG
jgi:hypothetical protein